MKSSPKREKLAFTALHKAAMNNDVDALNRILKRSKQHINSQDESGCTPLYIATIFGHFDAARILIEAGADVHISNSEGQTPIDLATDPVLIKLLEDQGAIKSDPFYEETHDAAYNGDLRALRTILKTTPEKLNVQDGKGFTPLHYAVMNSKKAVVSFLIKAGADLNILDDEKLPPIVFADEEISPLLEQAGALPYDGHYEAIHDAASQGDIEKLESILASNPEKIDIQDGSGYTPLMCSIMNNQIDTAIYLIKKDANIHLYDNLIESAVFHAARAQNISLIDLLIQKNAFIDELNSWQGNILEVAEPDNHETPTSHYLKEKIELPKSVFNTLRQDFKEILTREQKIAQQSGKRLLIMLGETHNVCKILQIEKGFYQAARELGIETLLVEQSRNVPIENPADLFAHNQLGMKVFCIDNYPCDPESEYTFVDERNEVMAKEIQRINRDCILRIGADHLYGLLQDDQTQVNFNEYHVVPFNLSSLPAMSYTAEGIWAEFAQDPSRVIQVHQNGLSNSLEPVCFWNQPKIAAPIPSIQATPAPTFTSLRLQRKRGLQSSEGSTSTPKKMKVEYNLRKPKIKRQ